MSGTLNVITSFLIGESYSLNDPEQVEILSITRSIIDMLWDFIPITVWPRLFPNFVIERGWHRKILTWFKPGKPFLQSEFLRSDAYKPYDVLFGRAMPLWISKIKTHLDTFDMDSPRDFIDFLFLESKTNKEFDHNSILLTTIALYTGGADTTSNTLRWFLALIAEHQDVQEQILAEVQQCKEKHGNIISAECHFTNSTLEEVFRFRPISESVMHTIMEGFYFEGHFLPAGSLVQGNFTAVHYNPEFFPEPEVFKADRFLNDGKFKVKIPFAENESDKIFRKAPMLSHFPLDYAIVLVNGSPG